MSAPEATGPGGDGSAGADGAHGAPAGVASAVEALSQPALVPAQRRRLVRRLARHARQGTGAAGRWRPHTAVRWTVDTISDITPHVPVRDVATLREHHPGYDGDALAERLVRNAARATAGVGATSGGLAAVKWTVPPALLSAPVLLGAETVAVVAIEIKLVGELHAVYQVPLPAGGPQRAVALLQSWAQQRGLRPVLPGTGAAAVLGTATRNELANRLAWRFGRNLPTLAPLLAGAGVAAYLNRRATRELGRRLRADLR